MSRPATARLKVNPPLGRMPVLQFLQPDELSIDTSYQRSIEASESQTLIRRIAQHWNWDLCQPLVVARRTGEGAGLFVIDGQHRLAAARLRRDIAQLPCVVVDYASAADEAASFVHLNQQRRALSAMDIFRAALASEDPTARAIMGAMEAAGLSLAPHSNHTAWKPGMVSNIGGIQRDWQRFGEAVVREALQVLGTAFAGEVLQYAGTIFPGVVWVCRMRMHKGALPEGTFAALTAKLGARGQVTLKQDIGFARAVADELDSVPPPGYVVLALLEGRPLVPTARAKAPPVRQVPVAGAIVSTATREFGADREGWPFCAQCDRVVAPEIAAACTSPFCKVAK